METLKKKYPKLAEAIVKIFAVMGLVIILMIAIYGALAALRSIPNVWQAIGNAFTSVTSVFMGGDDLDLKANPQNPVSGEKTTIKVAGRNIKDGEFEFAYECVDGVNFEVVSPTDDTRDFVFCNTRTLVDIENGAIEVIPTLVNKEFVSVTVSLYYTAPGSDESNANGSLELTVLSTEENDTSNEDDDNEDSVSTTTPPKTNRPKSPQVPNEPTGVLIPRNNQPYLFGYADLTLRVIDVGIVNPITGQYSPTNNIPANSRVGIRFEVINIGTNSSGNFRWNASLPTDPFYMYPSMPQQSLNPGDRIQYTLAFDGIRKQSTNQVSFVVDADNTVRESNETNNTTIFTIKLSNIGSGNDGCYTTASGSYICPSDERDRANRAIKSARNAIEEAEDEIDEAEDDGDDTDDAEDLLREAKDYLDDAEEEFDDGDYYDAVDFAEEAEDLAEDAIDEL